jgi:hypothetical protein
VGRSKQETLDRLIGEVARGERTLVGITDPELREEVRIALRLHQDANDLPGPDEYTRMRMRVRIMAGLRPRAPTLRDNAWTALWWLGRPAPYIARSIAISAFIVAAGMGATLASADALPNDLMYSVKVAAEGVRLALAGTPADRAAVELSIAEHRLAEAEKLALSGRVSDARVASAVYSAHIAAAAAELSAENEGSPVVAQLESSFIAHRERAERLAETLASDADSARAAEVLAMLATPTMAPGETQIERVADTAASLASDLADAAEVEAAQAAAFEEEQQDAAMSQNVTVDRPRESAPPRATTNARPFTPTTTPRGTDARATTATQSRATTAPPRATQAARATADARASDNARAARKAAEQARAAVERLKQALLKAKEKAKEQRDRR